MKGLQDLKGSIGRSASTKQAKKTSILPGSSQPANAPAQPSVPAPETETTPTSTITPGPSTPSQDMLAMWDAFARPPSQDITRPFDNLIPMPIRASETGSLAKRNKRRSLVSAVPPTVNIVEQGGFTPFGDAFKSFTKEAPSPIASLVSEAPTLNTNPEPSTSELLSPTLAESTIRSTIPGSSQQSSTPTPPKPTGIFKVKGLFRFKSKASSYWKSSEQIASKPVSTLPASSSPTTPVTPKIVVADSSSLEVLKEKNGSSSSLGLSSLSGSIRRLGRRSKDSRDSLSEGEKKESKKSVDESSEPPSSPIPDDAKSARRYAHGVLLHPIVENEEDK